MNLAALLAVLVAFSPRDGGTPPLDGGTGAARSEDRADGGERGGSADGGKGGDPADGGSGADPEILRHLDELENLELLQHLDLFDTATEPDRKP